MTKRADARLSDTFLREADHDFHEAETVLLSAPPVTPSHELAARLMASLATTHRFDDLEEAVAALSDLPIDRARVLLLDVDRAEVWEPGPGLGVELFHFAGGGRVQDAITGFVRMRPGVAFPEHGHVGDETVLVMTGTLEDSSGAVFGPGAVAHMSGGSHHSFRAIGRTTLLLMTIVQGGVILDGQIVPPGDPRA